ncbi:4-hydroxybenzoate octaprenyltransferase [Leucothrix pacifica]|uniref:4-hydroxybenzoate octaprenyltransferase n=1 Tax=Leucothrix pacifica TaxID=1247513 RepID=A0A317CL01_9GAMM|nr:4-hydroxybenzoate octaprenyltransferase [Leucothrix pacifica]PWQ98861.1 4-hydroxybenzoate octaprenyltransferase [Leucothrix pacifica]
MINLRQQFPHYLKLIRFDRPIGSYLLLWPTLWALWIAADGIPDVKILLIFVAGVFVMRSAGCAINDFADRDIDAHVERTENRPLATGVISAKEALGVFIVLSIVALLLALQLNALTIKLSVVAILLAASYPFMKRVHMLPQVHLGVAFAWAIPMAYSAINNSLPDLSIWLVFLTTIIWTTAYDTMYGMADREEDIQLGLKSTAILFGDYDKLAVGLMQLSVIILLALIGALNDLGSFYYIGVIIASVFFVYQQFLIQDRDEKRCFQAFLNNNWFGMVVFIGLALDYLI